MQVDNWEGLKHIKTVAALDVGQIRDYSVLTILEVYDRIQENPFNKKPYRFRTIGREFHVVYQEQKRGLGYPEQKEWILQKLKNYRELENKNRVPFTLLVETNGVGLTLFQLLKKEFPQSWHIRGCLLTNGDSIDDVDGIYHLHKKEIINSLVYVLDSGQLKIPHDLPTKSDLLNQASGFIRTFSETGREKLESDTESRHDDAIISLAYCVWFAIYRDMGVVACPSIYGSVQQAVSEYHVEPASHLDALVENFHSEWRKVS